MLATMLPTSTSKIFEELRTIGRKLVNYKSDEEFNGIYVEQDLVALGLRHKQILGIQEYELQEFYETQMKNAEKEVQWTGITEELSEVQIGIT